MLNALPIRYRPTGTFDARICRECTKISTHDHPNIGGLGAISLSYLVSRPSNSQTLPGRGNELLLPDKQ
jgi:hypothetical protein